MTSEVRFGTQVFSPMIPLGEADFLVVLAGDQIEPNRHALRPDGRLIPPEWIDEGALVNRRSLNIALLGALSAFLDLPEPDWLEAIRANLPEKLREMNVQAFQAGRAAARSRQS